MCATALSITTFSIMTLSITVKNACLSRNDIQHSNGQDLVFLLIALDTEC